MLTRPVWWNPHGKDMKVSKGETDLKMGKLVIKRPTVRVEINASLANRLIFFWRKCIVDGQFEGDIAFSADGLLVAFGLIKPEAAQDKDLIIHSQHACMVKSRFIKEYDYLNIPCPGTGNDGDPNVSILLTDEIREAIAKLLDS